MDPKYLVLGSKLNDQLPNPFFGVASAGPFATSATLSRAQLLRPFPEFRNVLARQVTGARNDYNAGVVELQRRVSHGWGGRFSYTYSRLNDNQFGESNSYSRVNPSLAVNNYDLDAEYSRSLLDVPHRLVLAPIFELPFGQGRKWANSGVGDVLLGGITIAALINFESGFPINIAQNGDNTGTFGGAQRPNLVPGVDLNTSGDREARFASWINPAAFTSAPAFTFGNAPRTDPSLRTPDRNNIDVAIGKDVRLGGGAKGQIRFELLNLDNHVKVNGPEQRFGRSNFGNIASQRGFMRITQVTFRLSF